MARRARAASEAGASVIVDATFQDAGARSVIAAAWRQPWRGYWLDAPRAVRLARVGARRGDVSDADVAVAAAQDEPGMVPAPWRRLNANRAVDLVAADIVNDRQAGDPAC
jgi:predicted kinase